MRTYTLTVTGPAHFTTVHSHRNWAFGYAKLYRATWPDARITLTSSYERTQA